AIVIHAAVATSLLQQLITKQLQPQPLAILTKTGVKKKFNPLAVQTIARVTALRAMPSLVVVAIAMLAKRVMVVNALPVAVHTRTKTLRTQAAFQSRLIHGQTAQL